MCLEVVLAMCNVLTRLIVLMFVGSLRCLPIDAGNQQSTDVVCLRRKLSVVMARYKIFVFGCAQMEVV